MPADAPTSDVHAPDCGFRCGGSYVCPGCARICGWCFGCGDDMPELCDDCWLDVTKRREVVAA